MVSLLFLEIEEKFLRTTGNSLGKYIIPFDEKNFCPGKKLTVNLLLIF